MNSVKIWPAALVFLLSSCGEEIIKEEEIVSPDKAFIATIWRGEGRGAVGWKELNIELRPASKAFEEGTDLIQRKGRALMGGQIKADWIDRRTLHVYLDVRCKQYLKGITILDEAYEIKIVSEVVAPDQC